MDLFQIKAFVEIAKSGSFSKAAERLHISQPAISRQILALEQELELQLFLRQPRGVSLTDAGSRFYEYAHRIAKLTSEAIRAMDELKNLERGSLNIVASSTIGNYLLPEVLSEFKKRYPGITLSLIVGNSEEVEQMILHQDAEIGVIGRDTKFPEIQQELLMEDEIVLVAKPGHPACQPGASPLAIKGETLILREQGSASREAVERHLASYGIAFKDHFSLGNTEAIKRAVAAGMGVAFLSKYTVKLELETGILCRVHDENLVIKRPLLIIYLKELKLSPPAVAFLSVLKQTYRLPS